MVESALFFVIGFLCAAMLAIFAAPAVSRRAMRLANARARLQAPLSEAQARAERDGLRAVHAVETVKMEKKIGVAEWDRAIAQMELARQMSRASKLEDSAQALAEDVEVRNRRLDVAEDSVRALEAESGAKDIALWDLTAQLNFAEDRMSRAGAAILDLQTKLDRDRIEIASLATQVSGLEMELADLRSGRLGFRGEDVQSLEARLRGSEAARGAQTLELARLMRGAAEREAALALAHAAHETLARKLDAKVRQGDEKNEGMRLQAQSLAEANASALAAERAERLRLQQEYGSLQSRLDDALAAAEALAKGDAALRLAIAKLGRDIVRSRAPQDEEPHGAAQIVSFPRREPIS